MNTCKPNKESLPKYLEPFLDAGADELILNNARKQYLKEYKKNWQREYRKNTKQFTISFNKKELTIITDAASKHCRKNNQFIKEAALAYCKQEFLFPNPEALNRIQELLIMNYSLLKELAEEKEFPGIERSNLVSTITKLETDIIKTLKQEMYARN